MFNVKLTPFNEEKDCGALYEYYISEDLYLFSTKLSFNSREQFRDWIIDKTRTEFKDFLVVKYNDKCIGFVHNYNFCLNDGHCKIAVYIDPKARQVGIGGYAAILYMKYLFGKYSLRKIYLTIYDYNEESLKSNLKAGFVEEGCLKEYRYYKGKYYGLHYLSMTREVFNNTLLGMVEK